MRFPGATYRNIYVSSQSAAERTLKSIEQWIGKNLRLKVNAARSGVGRSSERKFLGFRLTAAKRIGIAPESIERFKGKVREMWDARQSRTSQELRDTWKRYIEGWWGYFQLADERTRIFGLESWIRRHIRKCFWLRWHNTAGRRNALSRLGVREPLLKLAASKRGAWRMAANHAVNAALTNATLRRYGFVMPSDLAAR